MKECFGTAEPSPLTLISAGTASVFYVGKFSSFGLPITISSALVSYSQWGGVGGGDKVPWSRCSDTPGRTAQASCAIQAAADRTHYSAHPQA